MNRKTRPHTISCHNSDMMYIYIYIDHILQIKVDVKGTVLALWSLSVPNGLN